jgi:hypothetical protein
MSGNQHVCPVCSKACETQGGLERHFKQTQNPACKQFYRDTLQYFPALREEGSLGKSREASVIRQDFDIADESESEHGPQVPDSDSEEEEPAAGWEPRPVRSDSPDPRMDVDPDPPAPPGPAVAPAPKIAPTDRFVQKPHVTKFGGKAGAPLSRRELPVYTQYKAHLSMYDDPWAPFTSRMDWEIAQWAKIRGSTSTAFTDLLAIDGVCPLCKLHLSNSESSF